MAGITQIYSISNNADIPCIYLRQLLAAKLVLTINAPLSTYGVLLLYILPMVVLELAHLPPLSQHPLTRAHRAARLAVAGQGK